MDKDQKKMALDKIKPHLTAGKGAAALGIGFVFYALMNAGPATKVADNHKVDSKISAHKSAGVKSAPESVLSKTAPQNDVSQTAGLKEKQGIVAATKPAKDKVLDELSKWSDQPDPKVAESATEEQDAIGNAVGSKAPMANKTEKEAAKSGKDEDDDFSGEPKITDKPVFAADDKETKKAASTKRAAKEEEDDFSGEPKITDKPVFAADDKESKKMAKTKKAAKEEEDDFSGEPKITDKPVFAADDKESVKTAKAKKAQKDSDDDDDFSGEPRVAGLPGFSDEKTSGKAVSGLADAAEEEAEATKTKMTGLLSVPLTREEEEALIAKREKLLSKKKTTGLLSAPLKPGAKAAADKGAGQNGNKSIKNGLAEATEPGNKNMNNMEQAAVTADAGNITIKKSAKSNVSEFTLPNGMEVVVIPDHRAPVVTHMVWYKVGAADEPTGTSGIAHFLEHLMFKGTAKIKSGEFSKIIARNGGQDNAFTSQDATAYHQRVAKDRLRLVMEMEADRMRNLNLTENDVKTERDVILEERRSRTDNNPSSQFHEQMNASLYMNHPYGIPVIGWNREMKTLSRADALKFYGRYYAPNNAVLVIAGDVTAEEVKKLAIEIYGPIKSVKGIERSARPQEPPHLAARRITMSDKRVAKASWQRLYLAPGYNDAAPKEAEALDLLLKIMASGSTGRLYKSMVMKDKIASSAGGSYMGSSLDGGKISFYAIGNKGVKLKALEKAIDKEIALIQAKGVTQKELDSARNSYSADYVYANDNQVSLARRYGWAKVVGRTIAQVEQWPDMLAKVTVEDIQKVAKKYLKIEKSVTGTLLPEKKEDIKKG